MEKEYHESGILFFIAQILCLLKMKGIITLQKNEKAPNKLIYENSPYLLQHAYNPVEWYPWGEEAFEKAKREDKPIFLSIGYSTCHWCHVMEKESFEDEEVAKVLNQNFVSIKVDREIRPDIDSIYMSVCQAMTGSGGWPMSIFLTADQKPFFAGTYFPKRAAHGQIGFVELLAIMSHKWKEDKQLLLNSAESAVEFICREEKSGTMEDNELFMDALTIYRNSFDKENGGFGNAPKFPAPHNLLFLMSFHEQFPKLLLMDMVEKTLLQMYKGGLFDHVGGGFSRYSADAYFLVPHFEKMLYDNALFMMAYTKAYKITGNQSFLLGAKRTGDYILREMTDVEGGFYSAQDADSEGEEGKYYTFSYKEIIQVLGEEEGKKFGQYYGISKQGNFEGKNILNMLHHEEVKGEEEFEGARDRVYSYRKGRMKLHLDDKILTSWNALMIAAFAMMHQVFGEDKYLQVAKAAEAFIQEKLTQNDTLYVGYREGKKMHKGFLDDYAFYIFSLIKLYDVTLEKAYLQKARSFLKKTLVDFADNENGGFFLIGRENEQMISRPKETYDGAIPSGNSVMAYNLVRLSRLCLEEDIRLEVTRQIEFVKDRAGEYPTGHSFFMMAMLLEENPQRHVVCVLKSLEDIERIKGKTDLNADIIILEEATKEYPLLNGETTYYVCNDFSCLPPTNVLDELI